MQHSQHRARKHKAGAQDPDESNTAIPTEFGDVATIDHIIMGEGEQSVNNDTVSLVCYDRATVSFTTFWNQWYTRMLH